MLLDFSRNAYECDLKFVLNHFRSFGVDVRIFKDPKSPEPKEIEAALNQMEKCILLITELDQYTISHVPRLSLSLSLSLISHSLSLIFIPNLTN
jgi:hypothetical protein